MMDDPIGSVARKEVYTISQDETVGYLIRVMAKLRFRRFPVTDEANLIRGIVTSSDIILSMYNTGSEEFLEKTISEIMTHEIAITSPDTPVDQVILTMYNAGLSGLPLVEDEEIVGIFTEKDIVLHDDLWKDIEDEPVSADTGIGRPITDDIKITENFTFWQTADRLVKLPSREVLVYDNNDHLTGMITPTELSNAVLREIIKKSTGLNMLQNTNIADIQYRPLYQRSVPSVTSSLRMWLNSRGVEAFPLFSRGKPVKLITEKDLVGYLANHLEEFQ